MTLSLAIKTPLFVFKVFEVKKNDTSTFIQPYDLSNTSFKQFFSLNNRIISTCVGLPISDISKYCPPFFFLSDLKNFSTEDIFVLIRVYTRVD